MKDRKNKDIVNAVLAIAMGASPVTAKIATEIAINAPKVTNNMTEQFSRRDFLKLAGRATIVTAFLRFTPEGADGNFPTRISTTPQETLDSFKKAALSRGVDQKLVDQASAFTISVGFSNWDFLILPPTISTNSEGSQIETDERIFVSEPIFSLHGVQYADRKRNLFRNRFVELQIDPTRTKGADKVTPIVTWSMVRREPRPDKDQNDQILDPIIWYPQKTEEEWSEITKDRVLKEYFGYIGFAPPPSAGLFTNWIIERDIANAYPIDLSGELPEPSRRALIRRERVEISPAPALSPEVQEKFTKAGIDPKDLGIDQNGLHIIIDGNTVDVPLADLDKFTYQVNGVTGKIYQFQPVIDKETNNMILYTFNTETKTWEVTGIRPFIEKSMDGSINIDEIDIISGNATRSEAAVFAGFPDSDVKNKGWEVRKGNSTKTYGVNLIQGPYNKSEDQPQQLVSVYSISGDFLGRPNEDLIVFSVATKNTDGTVKFLHFLATNKGFSEILKLFPKTNGIGIIGSYSESYKKEVSAYPEYWYLPLIYEAQGETKILDLAEKLEENDLISPEMENTIWMPKVAPW